MKSDKFSRQEYKIVLMVDMTKEELKAFETIFTGDARLKGFSYKKVKDVV
jgi:hypothetical protein